MTKVPTITKKDVAKRTAKLSGEKMNITERTVDALFTALRQLMSEADPEVRIEIRDFGVFDVKLRKARIGRNPNKPEDTVEIPPRKVVKFKPGKKMREMLRTAAR